MNRNVIQRANLLSDFDRVDEVSVQPIRELDKTCGHLGKARLGQKRTSDYLRPCMRTLSKLTGCFLPSRFVMNIAQEFGAICRDRQFDSRVSFGLSAQAVLYSTKCSSMGPK